MSAAHNAYTSVAQLGLSPEQRGRLSSWTADIALDLRRNTPNYIDSTGELRIGAKGSLALNPNGCWYDFEAGTGGRDAVSLILHLADAAPADARQYAVQWLAAHSGHGTFTATLISDAEQDARDRANAEYAHEVLGRVQPIIPGTDTYTYLERRHLLDGPLPACIGGHLQHGRKHESAIVGILTAADGEVVAIQLGHLMADGGKSPITPVRNQYKLDPTKAKGATFAIPATSLPDDADVPEVVQRFADTIILCEGLEDAASLHRGFPYSAVHGFPGGIGHAVHFKVQKRQKIMIFIDGDGEEKEAARKSVIKGVDALIIAGATVQLATPPIGTDANDVLIRDGIEAIRAVAAAAVPAMLSPKGHYTKAAHTPDDVYEFDRKTLAHDAGIRVSVLDRERARLRQKDQPQEDDKPAWATWDDSLWPAPITDMASVCDAALNEVKRYVVGNPDELPVVVMWCLFAHFVHHPVIELNISPRLAIKAPTKECGKTTLLEVVSNMVPRPDTQGGAVSEATFRRLVDEWHVSVLIDEAHAVFRRHAKEGHLIDILKSSHRRYSARIPYLAPSPDGRGWELQAASTWTALCYTQIGRLADGALDDRALAIHLFRASRPELRDHLVDGVSPELKLIRQKFARFAADTTALPDIARSNLLFSRDGDNWMPLFRLARLLGGEWPARIMTAATWALTRNEPESSDDIEPLLRDIRTILGEKARAATSVLCTELNDIAEPSIEWRAVNRGRGVTAWYLSDRLRGLLTPPGAQKWKEGSRTVRGYERRQFDDAFIRYLGKGDPKTTGSTATPATDAKSAGESNWLDGGGSKFDQPPPTATDRHQPAIDPAIDSAVEPVAVGGGSSNLQPPPSNSLKNNDEKTSVAGVAVESVENGPSPHVFPDGVTTPFDMPPASPDDDDVFRIDGEPDAP